MAFVFPWFPVGFMSIWGPASFRKRFWNPSAASRRAAKSKLQIFAEKKLAAEKTRRKCKTLFWNFFLLLFRFDCENGKTFLKKTSIFFEYHIFAVKCPLTMHLYSSGLLEASGVKLKPLHNGELLNFQCFCCNWARQVIMPTFLGEIDFWFHRTSN